MEEIRENRKLEKIGNWKRQEVRKSRKSEKEGNGKKAKN